MSVIADPKIKALYEEVRKDSSDVNWLYLTYKEPADVLEIRGSGNGGFQEFLKQLKPEECGYGYVRINIGNDELSTRCKFILVSWVGSNAKIMRKAKISVQLSEVKSVIKVYACEFAANTLNDLKQEEVLLKVQKAMGANYDRQSSSY
eukprot:NODE_186_length_15678_cov_0.309262.p6 type:complete len:148 gc:universal NODE_186_length_15678_cov_0.309262:1456-1899(+)